MLIKKRQLLTATLVIALCAAVTVNWYFSKPQHSSNNETTSSDEQVTGNLGDTLFVAGTTALAEETSDEELTESEVTGTDETQEASEAEDVLNEESASSGEYFSQAKLKREKAYDEAIDNIEEILSSEVLGQEEKNKILTMLSDYENDMKVQTDTENLISAKTGNECLVVINGDNCQVVLEKNTLNDGLILQITEIIEKNTNIFSENLTIIELK